ncbi:hypothetical protein ABPG74_002044 [Tetrahymena malaccensis]
MEIQISKGSQSVISNLKIGFNKATSFVSKTVETIGTATNKVVNAISNGASLVTDKISEKKNFFLEKTFIGRQSKKGYNWLMGQSFIDKSTKYIGEKLQKMFHYFDIETHIGRGLVKLKKWAGSTQLGKYFNRIGPILSIISFFLGVFELVIGIILGFAKFFISNNKFIQIQLRKIANNRFIKFFLKGYIYTTKCFDCCYQLVELILILLIYKSDKIVNFVKRQNSWVGQCINFIKNIGSFGVESAKSISFVQQSQKYYNTNISTKLNTYLFQPADFLYIKVGKPALKILFILLIKVIQSTQLYSNVKKSVNILRAGEKLTQDMPEIKQILKIEQNIPNVSSKSAIDSYIKKYSPENPTLGVQKFVKTFEIINKQQEENEQIKNLNSLVKEQSIDVISINFNKNENEYLQGNKHSIDGVIQLKNNKQEMCQFKILDGQVFGCKVPGTSQHTVIRGIKGELGPLETISFHLEAFSSDARLSWPRNKSDYELSSIKLKNFNKNTSQGDTWDMTS